MLRNRHINVRLDADDDRKVRALLAQGVHISAIVRQAVRAEYARRIDSRSRTDAVDALRQIYVDHPSRPLPRRGFDVHDHHAFARAIQRRVKQR